MTSSYGIGGKPYMGVPGHGNMGVGPVVRSPLWSNNGGKPIDATLFRESTDKFEMPKQGKNVTPKGTIGTQGTRMANLRSWLNPLNLIRGRGGAWSVSEMLKPATDWAGREAVRGAQVALGIDTTDFDNYNAGRPVVRNVGGASYNIATEEGRKGYQAALKRGEKTSTPTLTSPQSVVDNPNDNWADPIAGTGPKGNEVGSDADTDTPGLQGPGAPGANPYEPGTKEHGMFIWARKHKGMAQDVLDKVEKRGLKQAGYTSIREALGQTPTTPPASAYEGGTGITGGEFEAPELKSDVKFDPAFKTDYNQDPQGFLNEKVSLLTTSASSLQQPNFDGTSQPIGGDTPKDPQPEQDFNNANTNPSEVEGYVGHPLNKKPSPEAEAANAEYGAMKFQFDPGKNMMIRIK